MSTRRGLRTSVSALALAWSAAMLAGVAQAGPQGGVVVSGSASIEQSGTSTVIRQQTSRADLSWESFDIGTSESVEFLQPSSSAIALNRIGGSRPSEIQGSLSANGHVWLMNPSGILFGDGAQVNVNGLLATTSHISEAEFAAGNDRFANPGGAIHNAGAISAEEGGVALVAPVIENTGSIATAGGDVTLHAGSAFSVDFHGDGLLSYVIGPEDPIAASLSNTGEIAAGGGAVRLSAAAAESVRESVVSLGGMVEATGLSEVGGEIVVTAPGQAHVTGTLAAQRGDRGGEVSISAEQFVLHESAQIDVSAPAGGGRVILGPRESSVPTARVAVQSGARIIADSSVDGDAGEILVWSEEGTWFNGHASAAARGLGDGGFIDISSAGGLRFTGTADLSAAAGEAGTLLFDPATITIAENGEFTNDAELDDGEILFGDGGNADFVITPGALAEVIGDILLQATEGITVQDPVTLPTQSMTLQSDGLIDINAPLTLQVGDLALRALGDVSVNAAMLTELGDITVDSGADIFVDSRAEVRGEHVSFRADGQFLQDIPFVIEGLGRSGSTTTIIGDGTADGDGVEITAAEIIVAGDVQAINGGDIVLIALGGVESTGLVELASTGSLFVEAGDLVIDASGDGGSVSLFGEVEAQDDITITATNNIEMANRISATNFESTAQDYTFAGPLIADTARIAFSGAGFIGPADNAGLNQFGVGDLSFAAEGGDLTIGSLNFGAPTFSSLTLTARDNVNVTGFLPGGGFDAEGFSPFALAFGEATGLRPTGVNSMGRIGVEDVGDGEFRLAPPSSLGFFVDGDVILDPEPQIDDGSVILHANGTTTIDVTGDFLQTNTLDPERTTELVNGVGGAGAVLGPVLLVNANSLELYGTVDGFETFQAVQGVSFGPEFTPNQTHQVNDCQLNQVTCLSDEGERIATGFPVGLIDPVTLDDPVLTPDIEALSGFFLDIGFIDPTLEEEEPITNRANDEGWPR